jgi:putative radical SAM enzyme (TIGR03279 family)
MVRITEIDPHGRAAKAGVQAGDDLVAINGNEIADVLDYRFYLAEQTVTLSLQREAVSYTVTLHKGIYDDIGLEFETPLMDKKQCCANRCIFCFIDQLPKGLRPSLYFKDDDARLSFLHGNYITLTNMRDADIDRIIKMHISPVNVSVHTTNPVLRCEMMKNKRAGDVLSYLQKMADAGIRLCGQIVLCRGVNDGEELSRSMEDLARLHPAMSSVSIVPAGLTRFREGLYPLEPFTPEECRAVIAQVNAFGDKCQRELGDRIFCCADEFYLKGELPLPEEVYYGDYEQIENGVGMLRSLMAEFGRELEYLEDYLPEHEAFSRTVSIVTGKAAAPTLRALSKALESKISGLTVQVFEVKNDFFGPEITVAGLLTGHDVAMQLSDKALGDELLIPATMLRAEGDLFLCGMSPAELSEKLHVPIRAVRGDGAELLAAMLGVACPY